MVRTNLDVQTDARMNARRHSQAPKCQCDNFVLLTAESLTYNPLTRQQIYPMYMNLQTAMAKMIKSLTHSHTMTPFDEPGKQAF